MVYIPLLPSLLSEHRHFVVSEIRKAECRTVKDYDNNVPHMIVQIQIKQSQSLRKQEAQRPYDAKA